MLNGNIVYNEHPQSFLSYIKIFGAVVLIVLFLIYSSYFQLADFTILFLLLLLASSAFILNFRIILFFFIISIFIGIIYYYFAISVYFSIFILISFLINYKFKLSEIKNPILPYFLIFIVAIIPSYFNSGVILFSMFLSYRVFAFFFVFTIISIFVSKYSHIEKILKLYVLMALINGIDVIYLALTTGKRVFGFANIMYVDLVNVALIICFIGFIYNKNKRFKYGLGTFILTCALIFTQTRGIWIVASITIISIMIHACFNSERIGIKKKNMILIVIISFLFLIGIVFLLKDINPGTYERVNLATHSNKEITVSNINSIATRYLIWTTAWNAFTAHPLIGIGYYSFPFTSINYSTINPILYEMFVKGLTAHTTILALLAEAGLLGFIGFLIFLFKTLKFAKQNLRQSETKTQWYYSLTIFWISFYISLSMIVTDAWLWGTLLMVWGIILGLSIANFKLIQKFNKNEIPDTE